MLESLVTYLIALQVIHNLLVSFVTNVKFLLRMVILVVVGTLNQGYPLLQYEDTVPVRRSLAAR
jgi:hypothetical protein